MRAVVIALLLAAGVAYADPVAVAPPAPTAPAPAATEDRNDPAWNVYHDAFRALLRGERARARRLVLGLVRDYPAHPATLLVQKTDLVGGPATALGDVHRQPEAPSRSAKAELALFQTIHGVYLGVELCIVAECDSGEGVLGLALLGGGVGLLASLNAVDNLTSGQRALLNSGTVWGAANAGLLAIAGEFDDSKTVGLTLMGGQLAGLGLGASLFSTHATAGQVGLVNSFGQWSGVVTALTASALSDDGGNAKDLALATLVAIDVGLVAGAYVAAQHPEVSRAQTLLIDAGGIVGTVGGASLGVVLSGDFGDRSTRAAAAAGAAIGVAAAAYLTRDMNRGDDGGSLHAYVAPTADGAKGGLAGVGFAW